MYSALIEKLGALPDHTKVFCGHEYTLQNLKFAKHVEYDNDDISDKIGWAFNLRASDRPTVNLYKKNIYKFSIFKRISGALNYRRRKKNQPLHESQRA